MREVRGVPQVAAFPADDILRRDRDRAAERVRPERRRTNQNADADPGNVGAGQVRKPAVRQASQRELKQHRHNDGEQLCA